MNLLPLASSTLVKNLPIHTVRSPAIRCLLYVNAAAFGYYLLVPGPVKLEWENWMV